MLLASGNEREIGQLPGKTPSVLLRNPVGRTIGMVLDAVRARAGNRGVLTVDPDHRQHCKDLIICTWGVGGGQEQAVKKSELDFED